MNASEIIKFKADYIDAKMNAFVTLRGREPSEATIIKWGQEADQVLKSRQELKKNVEILAEEQDKTELEIITELQAAAAAMRELELLDQLCELKDEYIYTRIDAEVEKLREVGVDFLK